MTNAFTIGGTATNKKDNPNCDYSSMNGTSAATPTISGVVSLMLAANPNLTWRDVREILRVTARRIDPNYGSRDNRNFRLDLKQGTFTASEDASLVDGSQTARLDLGWQKNAAGNYYSNWYGFGLADAAAAVRLAKATAPTSRQPWKLAASPRRSRIAHSSSTVRSRSWGSSRSAAMTRWMPCS
ncbi:S8 family serine peptidase [Cupriavidus basilensis]